MAKTAVVFSPIYYRHEPSRGHPESPQRLHAIMNELCKPKFPTKKNWQFVEPVRASLENVELIHGLEYVKLVEAVCRAGGGLLDLEDTEVSRESFEVALYAVGGTLKAVDLVMDRGFQNAFALVRPPGHHASKYRACGFCLFNNVAIAAKYLIEKRGLKRVLILDIDAHHGNGTQEAFYGDSRVLFVSIHEDPSGFPGRGFIDEVGEGEGMGFNINVPLPYGTEDQIYIRAFREIAQPIIAQYKPQFVLVSAGFDGHRSDPVGNLCLSQRGYDRVFEMIIKLALDHCGGRLVSVLEGGYSPRVLGRLVSSAIARMSGMSCSVADEARMADEGAKKRGEKVLREVKRAQSAFWRL